MEDVDTLLAHPAYRAAQDAIAAGHARFVEDIVTLTEIPAPPFGEAARAEAYRRMMEAQGLDDVRIDAAGNVTGLRRGMGTGKMVALAAHLDTVFPAGTDVTVRREGTRLFAPGIGDDTRGLAALLALLRAMDAGGIRTRDDLLFVADVGEEGEGDLRGIRHLFTDGEYAGRIDAFFTFDGMDMETLVTGAIGSHRYHVHFHGPGGHSFLDFGIVNPAYALAGFVSGLAGIEVPVDPRTTFSASLLEGGTSINAIPELVRVSIDLRSAAPEALARLDATVRDLIDCAVEAENRRGDLRKGGVRAELRQVGNRPASPLLMAGPVIDQSIAALTAFGFTPRLEASSTDANIPMSLGIPAVMIGSGASAGGAHTLGEWIDVDEDQSTRSLCAGLAAVLLVAGAF